MKKKSILSVIIIICIYFAVFTLSSCNKDENPVNPVEPPPVGPDTVSKYIWSLFRVNIDMYDVYAADTNKVFIAAIRYLLLYNGAGVMPYDLNTSNYAVTSVSGYDKENIFVWGEYYLNNNKRLPVMKKITNGVITSYTIADTGVIIHDMIVTGPNQAWFCEVYRSRLYYFNNGSFSKYTLPEADTLLIRKLYQNPHNEIFLFAIDGTQQTTGKFFTYKLINSNFVLQKIDCFGEYPCNSDILFRCGEDILMAGIGGELKYFDGNNWVHHSFDSLAPFTKLGGVSKDSLIGFNSIDNKIYTYGSNAKWRLENNSPHLEGDIWMLFTNLEAKYGNVYFTYRDDFSNYDHCFIIGRPNKNYKKF